MAKIVIVDYKLGNLFSVENAFKELTNDVLISSDSRQIKAADAIVLPGVGAFGEAVKNLEELGLKSTIIDFVKSGKPFLGVCLGLQLLFDESDEFGMQKGLGLINGKVKRLPTASSGQASFIPQVGWNKLSFEDQNKQSKSPLQSMDENDFVYFVHSYYVDPKEDDCILSRTNYQGLDYCSSVLKNNIFACQFHPEKSAKLGLSIYKNWLEQNKL